MFHLEPFVFGDVGDHDAQEVVGATMDQKVDPDAAGTITVLASAEAEVPKGNVIATIA